jgi:hypothetical protein
MLEYFVAALEPLMASEMLAAMPSRLVARE